MRRTIRIVEEKKKEKKKEKDRMEEYEKRKQWKICRYKKVIFWCLQMDQRPMYVVMQGGAGRGQVQVIYFFHFVM